MSYGWIIDRDHLPDLTEAEGTNSNARGVVGPRDIPEWMEDVLKNGRHEVAMRRTLLPEYEVFTFRMYDDDKELYYTGRMITDEDGTEEACFGPLDDFGTPNAGAVAIKYQGHPEMDCG